VVGGKKLQREATFENRSLRPANESDAIKIRDLIHRVHINPMDLNWQHFVIMETKNGDLIGCCQIKTHGDRSMELASLAVEEAYRGQGVARILIQHLLERSPRPLHLMCRPELASIYEKFGFRTIAPEAMPPYFRRIQRLARILGVFAGSHGPTIMRLE
jgi:N-acetylglutamate synthase-like GNAT family acetyltransferase